MECLLLLRVAPLLCRVDEDSLLYHDLQSFKEKEGRDFILLNFTFRVLLGIFLSNFFFEA